MEHYRAKHRRNIQLELVERIDRCKDYYEILNVPKEASDHDIRTNYEMLMDQMFNNNAPGANKACRAIEKAYEILIDPMKRQQYDWYDLEEERNVHLYSTNPQILSCIC